jgi:hypothetical protein
VRAHGSREEELMEDFIISALVVYTAGIVSLIYWNQP